MPTTPTKKRPLGRPAHFSDTELIATITELFWTHGYQALSLAAIAKAVGLKRSSLYHAFDNKDSAVSPMPTPLRQPVPATTAR